MKNDLKIRDEESLLLGLCRLEFSEELITKIRTIAPLVNDWNYFSSLANAHGVAALAYHNLEKINLLTLVPEEVKAYLRGTLMHSLSRNAFNIESMSEVLQLLNKEKIRTVLLKGLALELSVYGNEGLRQMNDVDILISRNQCIKAREILLRNGYESLPVKSIFHEFIIADVGKHLPSLNKNGTSFEIHHDLFGPRMNLLTGMLYDNSYEIELKGQKVFIPHPQIFFLYLIRHLNMHEIKNESQLRLYTDLVVLISNYGDGIINSDLLTYASQAGLTEILASRLALLRDLWGIPFQEGIDDFIKKWNDPDSINKFIFFLKSPKNNPVYDKPKVYRHIIRGIPGVHRKFLYLLGDLFPSVSFMKNRYNCTSLWKVLLYYPHRIGKVFWLFFK